MLSIKEAEQREAELNAPLSNGGVAVDDEEVCALLFGCYYGDALLLFSRAILGRRNQFLCY